MALRDEPFHLLRKLFQQHTAHWQLRLPALTKPQYAALRAIAERPGIEQATLSEAAASTKATLAEMLSRMESRGLVKRMHDPADKRQRLVYLTTEGKALLDAALPSGNEVDENFLARLSSAEREQFAQLIGKMMEP
ncbi:MarR family transcriptional regulator [Enterobacteriaceae bacterium H16N7]|nr:MarR family transcriptional regulator [Dryocola clanedunensis]